MILLSRNVKLVLMPRTPAYTELTMDTQIEELCNVVGVDLDESLQGVADRFNEWITARGYPAGIELQVTNA